MLPYIPDMTMTASVSYAVPFGAVLVAAMLAMLAIGIVVESHLVGTVASYLGGRRTVRRSSVATAAPRS